RLPVSISAVAIIVKDPPFSILRAAPKKRFSNTHEQIVIFIVNALALAVLLPYNYLSLLPIYSGLWVVGRILFWLGYRYKVLWRAPGFAMAVLPAVAGLGYSSFVVVTRLFT
ncbi:MAG: MAPEG family protein, partial [Immundisolibacteraceae bacterium]|nr:MAPEG family protein [Immundisolibacteraceae bacterium]